jgi:hypothetical protein
VPRFAVTLADENVAAADLAEDRGGRRLRATCEGRNVAQASSDLRRKQIITFIYALRAHILIVGRGATATVPAGKPVGGIWEKSG